MRVTRRELLCGAGSFVSAALLGEDVLGVTKQRRSRRKRAVKSIRFTDNGPLSGARLFEDLISYYNLGEHRTGTETDLRTSQWLMEQLRAAGLVPRR